MDFALTNTEFAIILNDKSKRIDGNIDWGEDEYHSPAREFRCEIFSDANWPLFALRPTFDMMEKWLRCRYCRRKCFMTTSKDICDALRGKIGTLFVCSSQGEYCRI